MLTNWNANYVGTGGNRYLSLPSEGVLAYHHNAVPRPSLEMLPPKHKAWIPLIIQNMQVGSSVLPDTWYSSQQPSPAVVGEELYRGYLIAVLSDGLRVIKVNAVGNGKLMQNLQHQFYVLVRGEHLGYGYEGDRPSYWVTRGGYYAEHGQNLEIGGINWHGHEAAVYLNNYGKQRFFGIKGSEAELYHHNRDYLSTVHYDGVFVLYEKNGRMQVGLASLIEPGLLSVQHMDGTSETMGATEIKDVLVVHHSDYAGGGRQVSISPTDMQPLNAEEFDDIFDNFDNNEVFEDDVLLARVVMVLTGGWRLIEISSAQEDDGEVFPLEPPILGLVNEDSWSGD